MFRHSGKKRTLSHKLKIASLRDFVAGIVNVVGFLAVHRLTTNLTGHFAFFMRDILDLRFWEGFLYFLYIFFFFAGSFVSSFLIELISKKSERFIYTIPASLESLLLLVMGIWGSYFAAVSPNTIAC